MKINELLNYYNSNKQVTDLLRLLENQQALRITLNGLAGSLCSIIGAVIFKNTPQNHVFILSDREEAAYFFNDLENIFDERGVNYNKRRVLFYPTSYRRHFELNNPDRTNVLSRTEVLNRLSTGTRNSIIVTHPEALTEKVISQKYISDRMVRVEKGDYISLDYLSDLLVDYGFERVDFVYEPGQFSIRGGIVDVFSFSNDNPYRIEFFGDEIETIRTFNPANQLSIDKIARITILPNIRESGKEQIRESFFSFLPENSMIWFDNATMAFDLVDKETDMFRSFDTNENIPGNVNINDLVIRGKDLFPELKDFPVAEFNNSGLFENPVQFHFNSSPQPSFNKNFELLINDLRDNTKKGFENIIISDNPKQIERIYSIFDDLIGQEKVSSAFRFDSIPLALHAGFIDHDNKILVYTDHQIFDRYHRFRLKDHYAQKEAISLKEIYNLNPGDFITHIDHGVGRFEGLEKIDVNGKQQEAIRISYANNDLLYISIHSLHRISKYIGKEGTPPKLNRLGTNNWNKIKSKTKKRVKDIARDLIKLYAERKASSGFGFTPDTYLQHELEASFIYEDTPDQLTTTQAVKKDMEADNPMDRLVCGDVGFGKTEIAIRAAFKAVTDSKQVAVLVPTTILAFQHYRTFTERLKDFPCNVDFINRFKSRKKQTKTLNDLKSGEIDILIGTHRLVSNDIEFKDLGLLIIDEEQKFGVATKEKLKQFKANVDTLTLTATPIPRTLQFSLMGARDLSVITTPPPNRYPIQTEIRPFGEDIIRDAIKYEISRGGQVYFVHNRIQNIMDVAHMVERFVPGASIAIGHGRMDGSTLEKTMLDFIEGVYDVLIATTIIESGLDIPNVNTIIINDAQNYGLSDLHQLRGRVGRSNKKAFCYLLSPPLSVLSTEARKRLKAIEEFSDLGSGFNIAMRDLDIRGAGNILGAEQSGFISEIGYEMYQKILNEAIQELKETDFKGLFPEELPDIFVSDCIIETDLELLIPDSYISNITERMSLYKELDGIEKEEDLRMFLDNMIDRFGPVPPQVEGLMNTVRLRREAKNIGFEKLVLKNDKLVGHFTGDQESPYYQSGVFSGIIKYVQKNPGNTRLKEINSKLTLEIFPIKSVFEALDVLRGLY